MPGFAHPVDEKSLSFESLGRSVRVDAYVPQNGRRRHPAAIVLHGSSGIHLIGGESVRRYAEALARRGVAAYVVYYFDATGTFTASDATEAREYWRWVRVVHDAVGWARSQPEVRASHVGLFGVSLGAYVSVGAAATDPRVSRVVLVAGGLEPGIADSVRRFPPALLLHGAVDDVVPVAAEDTLARLLTRRRVPLAVHRYAHEGHDFREKAAVDAVERAARFLTDGAVETMLEVLRRADTRLAPRDTARVRIP